MDDQVDVYRVTMLDRAYRDLDGIYDYIANTLIEPGTAMNIVDWRWVLICCPTSLDRLGQLRAMGIATFGCYFSVHTLFTHKYVNFVYINV